MGTEPNNASNMVTAQLGVDLPGFVRNRYMGTFSFNSMTQNESFIPMTINSAWATRASIPLRRARTGPLHRPVSGAPAPLEPRRRNQHDAVQQRRHDPNPARPAEQADLSLLLRRQQHAAVDPPQLDRQRLRDRVRQAPTASVPAAMARTRLSSVLHQAKRLGPDHLESGELGDRRRQWRMGAISLFGIRRQ